MEFTPDSERPYVRIGSLQHEQTISFTALTEADVYDLESNRVGECKKGETYAIQIGTSTPALIRPVIRLGIAYRQEEAEQLLRQWEDSGLKISTIRVGEYVQLAQDRFLDQREFWILAEGFSSIEEAEKVRNSLSDFGSYQIFQIPEKPASGTIIFEDCAVEEGIRIVPREPVPLAFTLHNVRVGIGFHWDHREDQQLENILEVRIDKKGLLTAINVLDIEHYLASVNSSEMVADCSLEFLKAQTVVARCTVFATAGKHHYGDPFDLCADDHCQCFHGSGAIQQKSRRAAEETEGQVLMFDGRVCDTRYAKVCGGIGETYQNVWDDRHLPYLDKFVDSPQQQEDFETLEDETKLRSYLEANPDVFCNPRKHQVPDYLSYAHDYFRWQVVYEPEELGEIVADKTGRNLGAIQDILPVKRGYSGRLIYVKLIGDRDEMLVGKELEIRRVLSRSHLYSSCFLVEKDIDSKGRTTKLILRGAGWGHGVGLCQVGAAVMGEEGYSCEEILKHYYRRADYRRIY